MQHLIAGRSADGMKRSSMKCVLEPSAKSSISSCVSSRSCRFVGSIVRHSSAPPVSLGSTSRSSILTPTLLAVTVSVLRRQARSIASFDKVHHTSFLLFWLHTRFTHRACDRIRWLAQRFTFDRCTSRGFVIHRCRRTSLKLLFSGTTDTRT